MKRCLFFAFMFILLGSLWGARSFSFLILSFEPSCINLGIGGAAVGGVNIWHKDALTSYSNPAAGAFREGISWGFSEKDWLKDTGFGYRYNASLVNIGYKGLSITLPTYKLSEQSGQFLDCGIQTGENATPQAGEKYHCYDTVSVYGIAINASDLADKYLAQDIISEHIDVAVGVNYKGVKSYLAPPGSAVGIGKGGSWDVGAVGRISWEDVSGIGLEVVGAYNHNNVFNAKSDFGGGHIYPIYERESSGYAFAVNLSGEKVLGGLIPNEYMFFDRLSSFRYLHNNTNEGGDRIQGFGYELGLFDTFFIRKGRYKHYAGDIVGNTSGYGINLHYKELISLSWNYAEYPGGLLMNGPQKAEDINVNVDFITMGNALNKLFSSRSGL